MAFELSLYDKRNKKFFQFLDFSLQLSADLIEIWDMSLIACRLAI